MASFTARAEAILEQARKLDAFLESEGLPYPTFDFDPFEKLQVDVQDVRWSLENSLADMKKLVRGPVLNTLDIATSWTDVVPLLLIYRYKLANAVPISGGASYAEIAEASGLRESHCKRIIRCAIPNNIFDEDATGRVRHTVASREFIKSHLFVDAIGLQTEEYIVAGLNLPKVWDTYGQDVGDPSKSAFSMINNGKSLYDVMKADPERRRRFGGAMEFYVKEAGGWDTPAMLKVFDWVSPEFDKPGAVVIDLGGGNGQVSAFLAKHTKHLHFQVQDLPGVVEAGKKQDLADIQGRVSFLAHDFFEPQPAQDTPPVAFLLRYILHNWSDQHCIQILRNLRPALRSGSRLLLWEYLLEDGPVRDLRARFNLQVDMIMAAMFNAQERTPSDFTKLLNTADPRFQLRAVRKPDGKGFSSIVEVEWTE